MQPPDSQVPKRSEYRKTFRIKLLMCGRTKKDIDSGLIFAVESLKNGKWVLESP